MQINKRLTKVNYWKTQNKKNEYIVIHYVGATGGAEDNCKYFEKFYRGTSSNYFVGHAGEVWQCVEDHHSAWHCGATTYKHKFCRNTNSIGIEMCCRKGINGWYFEPATIAATIDLVKELMAKHNIPVENVIRHYDVTGKHCPEPYVRNVDDWNSFKAQLSGTTQEKTATPFFPQKGYFSYGDMHDNIARIAQFMRDVFPLYTPEAALGEYYGPNLRAAVKEFQRRTKITTDGVFGPQTLAKLKEFGFRE